MKFSRAHSVAEVAEAGAKTHQRWRDKIHLHFHRTISRL